MTAAALPPELLERASRVSLLVLDVDGVMTDGRITYAEYGDELKSFDVRDGAGIVCWGRAGLKSAIITSRTSRLVRRRAKELGVNFLAQGQQAKLPVYEKLLKKLRIKDEQACIISDDLMELAILRRVGFAVAVSDAVEEVKRVSHYVTTHAGGRGAVREVVELVLKSKGLWDQVIQQYS